MIAISGSYGTLSEIAYALINGVPLVGLDTWDFDYHAGSRREHRPGLRRRRRPSTKAIAMAEAQPGGGSDVVAGSSDSHRTRARDPRFARKPDG